MPPDELAALGLPINVNEASTADLDSLPGIGPKMATRIIEGRPYARFEDLLSVRGIGPKRLADLQPRARLHWD
jgi:competence protein ComEA